MKKILLLIIFSTLLAASCAKHISDKPKVLHYTDNGQEVSVFIGQNIDINLIENSSEGKVWGISPYTTTIIGFISSKFQPDEKIKGAGGYRIIRFRALRIGESKLKITYYKTQKAEVTPIKEFKITVKVVHDKK
jgi:predicted secreted protein